MANYQYPKIVRRPANPPERQGLIERSNALEKWGRMRETTVEHFKFTPRTSTYAIIWGFLVPFTLFNLIRWERRWKERDRPSDS